MTPYAAIEACFPPRAVLARHVRILCALILTDLATLHPTRSHVRYSDDHVSLVYWPLPYVGFAGTAWQPGVIMETHGKRFYNELEGRVLKSDEELAASLWRHLPKLRAAQKKISEGISA